jgi:hypothetical protein
MFDHFITQIQEAKSVSEIESVRKAITKCLGDSRWGLLHFTDEEVRELSLIFRMADDKRRDLLSGNNNDVVVFFQQQQSNN